VHTRVPGVRWYWDLGDHLSLAAAFEYVAMYGEAGNPSAQVQWCAAAHALRQSPSAPAPVGELEDVQRQLAKARAELGDTTFQTLWAESCATSTERQVHAALNGGPPGTPRRHGRGDTLTAREREVARLLADGASDRQIAERLTITEGTAGLHVHHILAKLGLRSRVQVTHQVAADGFVDTSTSAPTRNI
jgi:DNA-binding NarL/FixJ family response regulator